MIRSSVLASLTLLAATVLTGCSEGTIAQADVEEQVTTQLTETVGEAPEDVTCPGDLEPEVGATMTCVLSAGGETIDVAVEVTEIDGDQYIVDIQVADEIN